MPRKSSAHNDQRSFWHRHSLGLTSIGILLLWIALYLHANPSTHWGSFFGNAIADWTGMVVTIYATKHLYEKGSAESREPHPHFFRRSLVFLYDHSLTIFLVVTGAAWIAVFAKSDPEGKWGQVVGNIVSEWTQIIGIVVLTKHLIEYRSKESSGSD